MTEIAEPLGGWDFAEVLSTQVGTAANDLYGKLFAHVRSVLFSFVQHLRCTGVEFELHNLNATELPQTLAPTTFARIEV